MSTPACLVAHADWSVSPTKRWLAVAMPAGVSRRVRVEQVGIVESLLDRLKAEASGRPVLFGVDAPVGLPQAYAIRHAGAARDFPGFLAALTPDSSFFSVCDAIEDVSGRRPFFPQTTRLSPRQQAHAERLGVAHHDELLRRCERKTADRPRAASLFWTLGANQVGKAALSLWRELLLPALHSAAPPGLWPFDGELHHLLDTRRVTVAETYPAEALRRMRPKWRGSKRRQADRASLSGEIGAAMRSANAVPEPGLAVDIENGFGTSATGEDRFDALLGLLGMLAAVQEPGSPLAPDAAALRWEGWILGQRVEPLSS